jgi:aldose 1-epimerase
MTPPVRLANDSIEVEVLPAVGARLHRLRAFGCDLLRTPADPAEHVRDPFFWGAYHMAPWGNRIAATPTRVGAALVNLPSNFGDGTAIHGQVYSRPWRAVGDGSFAIDAGGDDWPWRYSVNVRVALAEMALSVEQTLVNTSPTDMPAGLGLHPWFRRPLELAIDADEVIPSNSDPDATAQAVEGGFDLRHRAAPASGLDATWTAIHQPAAELRWPTFNIAATMRTATSRTYIVAATPDSIDAVAVEPQTHAPGGLRRMIEGRPGALTLLPPQGSLTLSIQIAFRTTQEEPS